jgi:hypothetical protein
MASDITLAVGDGARRMTYAELAQARDISLASTRRLARRHRWPRQAGNDGLVRILVPLGHLHSVPQPIVVKRLESRNSDVPRPAYAATHGTSSGTKARAGLGHIAIEMLREQLTKAERRADDERARAERSETERRELQSKLDGAQAQLAYAQGAERVARDEAAGLRTRLDQLQARGLWARLRNKR